MKKYYIDDSTTKNYIILWEYTSDCVSTYSKPANEIHVRWYTMYYAEDLLKHFFL